MSLAGHDPFTSNRIVTGKTSVYNTSMNPLINAKKPILIMAPSPSLPNDMAKVDFDCIKISCNWRPFRVYGADYICYIDGYVDGVKMPDVLKNDKCKTISNWSWADYHVPHPVPRCLNTGIYAIWLASKSNQPVILAGFEFYQVGNYFDSDDVARESNKNADYAKKCIDRIKLLCKGADIRVMSGLLVEHFKAF